MKKAYREWIHGSHKTFWVSEVPGEGGKDWGYTEDSDKAKLLNVYWQRRFRKDCERVGYVAHFV
jgi:hypothetical protein